MQAFQIIALSALAVILLTSTADAQCASNGIQLNNQCGQFTQAIKDNTAKILAASCSDLQTELFKPQYGTPSDGCCQYSKSFFGANCACDAQTQNQARLFFGYSTDQLKAAATAAAIRCSTGGGCGSNC